MEKRAAALFLLVQDPKGLLLKLDLLALDPLRFPWISPDNYWMRICDLQVFTRPSHQHTRFPLNLRQK